MGVYPRRQIRRDKPGGSPHQTEKRSGRFRLIVFDPALYNLR
jgi:hypothetical protein